VGEGGFGAVYVAEQQEPVRRLVALKTIKLGMDTRQVVARFEAERQTLALMEHPNIAKVLEAGATEAGRPYFVMELVRGVPITRYCNEHQLSTAERLALFIQVCHAIQHAHQKGIIHRDLKPSNILVTRHDADTAAGVPKVIDFGIAKARERSIRNSRNATGQDRIAGKGTKVL
jgi:eukaryotic-like serine/threonine-protein kinase